MVNYIIIAVVVAIVGGACLYIRKEKKQGAACVGCPNSRTCGGCCSCGKQA